MTTTTISLTITCPEWCEVDPAEHASELWNLGGNCVHSSHSTHIADPTGYQEAMLEPRFHDPVHLFMTTSTSPEGIETASPVVYVDDREHSIEQALALAEAITAMVAACREAGGVK